ncbi:MAG: ATP-binding protein [Candidatus Aenigmarchaeota archaeon]|nr:ATP-binding protein [Candidatus Aenigmarchaeota archaeon]
MNLKSAIFTFRLLSPDEKQTIKETSNYISKKNLKQLKILLKRKLCKININPMPYSKTITSIENYPVCTSNDPKYNEKITEINNEIKDTLDSKIQEEFKNNAFEKTTSLLAPKIIGFDTIKKVTALQLFSKDPYHILLLGDPGTGKTDILRAAEILSPISAFGLGSGTSNTGLTITVSGKEVKKGILSLADGGLALIDELNLMKQEDRAGLYNAMEKGFVTYDKGGHHYKFPANCSLLASANPKKDKIIGHDIFGIKKQIPLDIALLSRFHMVFLIRKQNLNEFMNIADEVLTEKHKSITKKDTEFMKKYIEYAKKINIIFPEQYNDQIMDFVQTVKLKESKLLFDITPRFVIGIKRLIESSARLELRTKVEKKDVDRIINLYLQTLKNLGL